MRCSQTVSRKVLRGSRRGQVPFSHQKVDSANSSVIKDAHLLKPVLVSEGFWRQELDL